MTMLVPMLTRSPILTLVLALVGAAPGLAPTAALAHHGQEFLLVQDASTPEPLSGSLFTNFEWSKYASLDELSVEPGFLLGLAPNVALGATLGVADEGDGWRWESVAPYLHVRLTPDRWPVRVAVMAGWEFGADRDRATAATRTITTTTKGKRVTRTVVTTVDDGSGGGGTVEPVPCGPEYGPDAPPCDDISPPKTAAAQRLHAVRHAGHAASTTTVSQTVVTGGGSVSRTITETVPDSAPAGIHRHGESHFFARLIVEADLSTADKLMLNLINVCPRDGKPAWGYAAGVRHSFSHQWAVGLEAIGDFGEANEHEAVLGAYWSPTHHVTAKLGVGTGLTAESSDFSLRTGLLWRF